MQLREKIMGKKSELCIIRKRKSKSDIFSNGISIPAKKSKTEKGRFILCFYLVKLTLPLEHAC